MPLLGKEDSDDDGDDSDDSDDDDDDDNDDNGDGKSYEMNAEWQSKTKALTTPLMARNESVRLGSIEKLAQGGRIAFEKQL